MKVYTVNATSYECARDIVKYGDFEDFSPFAVHQSRQAAETAVLEEINEALAEEREFEEKEDDKLPGFTDFPDILPAAMEWTECTTYMGKPRWKYVHDDETMFVISELELGG